MRWRQALREWWEAHTVWGRYRRAERQLETLRRHCARLDSAHERWEKLFDELGEVLAESDIADVMAGPVLTPPGTFQDFVGRRVRSALNGMASTWRAERQARKAEREEHEAQLALAIVRAEHAEKLATEARIDAQVARAQSCE